MTVSRRLRFEILTRDNNTCKYCGRAAPEVKLTVDHVTPVALGGTDEPTNLVAACADCNGGKSSIGPSNQIVADVAEDALRWKQAIKAVAEQRSADRDAMEEASRRFRDNWMFQHERRHHLLCTDHDVDWCPFELPPNFAQTVAELLGAGLATDDLVEAVRQAWGQDFRMRSAWKYFCGVGWKMVKSQTEAARALLDGAPVDEDDGPAVFRLPRREITRVILGNLMDDTEADAIMKEVVRVEELWDQRVRWGLENGYHRERAHREAMDGTKHDLGCTIARVFREADGRAAAAKFKADMAARAARSA